MTKAEMVKMVAEESGLKRKEVESCLKALSDVVTEAIENKEEFQLLNLGKFKFSNRAERQVRNPKDGTPIGTLPAYQAPSFKIAKGIRDRFKPEVVQ